MPELTIRQLLTLSRDNDTEPEFRRMFSEAIGVTVERDPAHANYYRGNYRLKQNGEFFGLPRESEDDCWAAFTVTDGMWLRAMNDLPRFHTRSILNYVIRDNGTPSSALRRVVMALTIYLSQEVRQPIEEKKGVKAL